MGFAELLSVTLESCGLSQNRFAKLVGVTGPFVNMICRGKARPPLDRIEVWADKLGLEGERRAEFLRLAVEAHVPVEGRRILKWPSAAQVLGEGFRAAQKRFAREQAKQQAAEVEASYGGSPIERAILEELRALRAKVDECCARLKEQTEGATVTRLEGLVPVGQQAGEVPREVPHAP